MSEQFSKPSDYAEYSAMICTASPESIEWIKHKCMWERMGRFAVAMEWGIPTREQAIACGVRPLPAARNREEEVE